VFCLDVAYVSQICCTNMFQMFHLSQIMLHPTVSCCKCFAWARCMGTQPERRGWGAMSRGPAPGSRPRGERGEVRGTEWGTTTPWVSVRGGVRRAAWAFKCEERRAQHRGQGSRASASKADGGGLRISPSERPGANHTLSDIIIS
jgi:hypothetical protein